MTQTQAINLVLVRRDWHAKRCQCECRNLGVGVCHDALVGAHDPHRILCDLCYYELTRMKGIRKHTACRYPSEVPSRPSSMEE
ncbi:hypothetical protein GGS26DRAFT_437617 [Hypomontagnella submonticulosa]|nr:hypothetical protein GGS26DRAFT_437617 [Hypomontagnella submonticulosa]